MENRWGNSGNCERLYFLGFQNHCRQWLQTVTAAMKLKDIWSLGKKSYDKTRQNNKKQRHHLANKGPYSQNYSFSSRIWMGELDYKEDWALKNWCFPTVVLEKTLESLWDSKEIKPVNPKGNQLWIFIGRTDAEAEAPILWPPYVKSWLIGKDLCWESLRAEEKRVTKYQMVGWDHQLNGHEFEQTPGDSDGQGSLACCSSWGHKESDTT